MQRNAIVVVLLVCASACHGPGKGEAQPKTSAVSATPDPAATNPDSGQLPGDTASGTDSDTPPEVPATGPARRWVEGVSAAPSLKNPPPTSVLGQLPEAQAIALVEGRDKLELVAAVPSGWRLELAIGNIYESNFEPASGLVFFYRDRSIWAIDLLEPLSGESGPAEVELARMPAKAPEQIPAEVILCVPPPQPRPIATCWPEQPSVTDVDWTPEYLEINWSDAPEATWYVPRDDGSDEYRHVELKLVGKAWLQARADRRQHFETVDAHAHNYHRATPLPGAPNFDAHCEYAGECGKSVPLGVSGWEWVVIASSQGDLFHPSFAVFDPSEQLWASWEQLVAGSATWIPTSELVAKVEEIGVEADPLFDGSGRVFVDSVYDGPDRLCWFDYDAQTKVATKVSCEPAGDRVVAFLSVPPRVGKN